MTGGKLGVSKRFDDSAGRKEGRRGGSPTKTLSLSGRDDLPQPGPEDDVYANLVREIS